MPKTTEKTDRRLRVFLCHASDDKLGVRGLYSRLSSLPQVDVWLDEEELLPGQEWEHEITKAIRSSHVIIVCLSGTSVYKEGYVQKEIRLALEVAKEKPEGMIFLIPVRFEECEVPSQLQQRHRADLFDPKGYDRLLAGLQARAAHLGMTISVVQQAPIPHPERPGRACDVHADWKVDEIVAEIERIRSISDRDEQLREASLAAERARARIRSELGGLMPRELVERQLQVGLSTSAHLRLSEDELGVLAGTPEAYLPGVLALGELEGRKALFLDTLRFLSAFDTALRKGSQLGGLLKAMAESQGL